jgi:predicted ABC-type transport system involved in lysophospholipase L1 biosynthesis ATPase subunit
LLLTYKENVHSTQMYIPLKPLFSRHKGIGVQFTDEPTGNLDSRTSSDVLGLLKVTSQKFHQTLVMITHNNEIAQLADRIIRIEDGKIAQ